jgi:hypothetical protein
VNRDQDITREHAIPTDRAVVTLVGEDGNAFNIMGLAVAAMRRHGYADELIEQYKAEAMAGDYDNLLRVTMAYVEVS